MNFRNIYPSYNIFMRNIDMFTNLKGKLIILSKLHFGYPAVHHFLKDFFLWIFI